MQESASGGRERAQPGGVEGGRTGGGARGHNRECKRAQPPVDPSGPQSFTNLPVPDNTKVRERAGRGGGCNEQVEWVVLTFFWLGQIQMG